MEKETYDKSRVINFTDAVFSIAVTLLVLEIVLPSYKEFRTYDTLEILQRRIPSFIGLIVSFLVITLYWINHMRIFKHVTSIDTKLLWYTIFLLFFVVLLPFSTGFYVKGFNYIGPFVFYCFNLSAIGLFNLLINVYVSKKEKGLTGITPILAKYYKYRALNALLIWVITGVLALVWPYIARFLFILLFVFEFLITRNYKRKIKREAEFE
ncbi:MULTISPECIES: TMEM175 family protein [Tenacibaculum]|uniref:TMEM175 family protein n=1 Tax=Tenacibaculum TaxID=104267 RepID=UPI001F0AE190|nr:MULTISPECIES: TMEM175 family protein [Tenacibaculum]MCH3882124.1 DUF1211 domain-containing protein [Tenacibaculum aquimarinum]MCH3885140.1 DUF1211 domain-containing protein [Tenacibaculum aquimarinum]MDO6599764.1 TMEM175 family protein [Tenacibaculum sp. 1_MG-2023]